MNIKTLLVSASRKFHLRLHPALRTTALVLAIVTVMLASNASDVQAADWHYRCHGDWVEEGDSKKIEVVIHGYLNAFTILWYGGTATKGVDFEGAKPIPRWDVHFGVWNTTERTPHLLISPLGPNWVATDSGV